MSKILIYLKAYRKECFLGPFFKLLEATFELIIPLLVADIIDQGIPAADQGYIIQRTFLMVAFCLVGMLAAISAQYFSAKAAVGFAENLRHELFSHIQKLSFQTSEKIGSETLITRMTGDINQVQTGVNLLLRLFLRSPFIVIGAAVMAAKVYLPSLRVFVSVIVLLSLVVFGMMALTTPLYKKVQSKLDKILGLTRQNLSGVRVIRAFNLESDEKAFFELENESLTRFQMKVGKLSALMNPLTYGIVNAGIAALIQQGAIQVNLGSLTQGETVALINYMSQILVELVKMANLIITLTKALACADRIQEVLALPAGMEQVSDDSPNENNILLDFEHVCLTYPKAAEETLTDIHFSVRPGETVGIIGGTGSGKSSLIQLIPRFYDLTSGKLRVNGKDIRSLAVEDLRARIGFVQQKAVLFKGTIRENMRWGNEQASDEEITQALRVAQAESFLMEKNGLDTAVEQEGRNFSGGQRQRLSIARALVRHPELLILDDSFSALDYRTESLLRGALKKQNDGMTTIIVTQRTASILHADQIIVLDDGKICGIGRHEELLKNCAVYREIYESQFGGEGASDE